MSLCGFLSPKGEYLECESFEHTSLAVKIAKEKYDKEFERGIYAEDFLAQEGYVFLTARSASFLFVCRKREKTIICLTSEQKDFLINNLNNTNNKDQLDAIQEILNENDDYSENLILGHYEIEPFKPLKLKNIN